MNHKSQGGFTFLEITIILLVLMILGATLLPMAQRFIVLARLARVKEDIGALAAVVSVFRHDTGLPAFLRDGGFAVGGLVGSPPPHNDYNRVDVLFGDGDAPELDILNPPPFCTGIDFWGWFGLGPVFDDTIANQLSFGNPLGDDPLLGFVIDPNDFYARPQSIYDAGFRGAYIQTPIQPDPWGNRYAINVAFLHSDGSPNTNLFGCGITVSEFLDHDVFVLSAGPDETINTSFMSDGVVAQGDDMIAVITGRGRGIDELP